MKKSIVSGVLVVSALIMSGCVNTLSLPTISQNSANRVMTYETGTVTAVRDVIIKDNGAGTLLGAVTGAVLGNMIGKGKGRKLATLGGGLVGAYAGNQSGMANAQELTVHLDKGMDIIVVAKGVKFSIGSRVKIIKDGNKVVSINPL